MSQLQPSTKNNFLKYILIVTLILRNIIISVGLLSSCPYKPPITPQECTSFIWEVNTLEKWHGRQKTEIKSSSFVDRERANSPRRNSQKRENFEGELSEVKSLVLSGTGSKKDNAALRKKLNSISYGALSNGKNSSLHYIGMEALKLQLHLRHKIPITTMLLAIRRLCETPSSLIEIERNSNTTDASSIILTNSQFSYRLLQRILSAKGVRYHSNSYILERDICGVLKGLIQSNNISMAHKLLLLQERSNSISSSSIGSNFAHIQVPPVTAVGYSILLRAYAKKGNHQQIESLVKRAYSRNVTPDVIFLNSLIDGYIECEQWSKVKIVFQQMKDSPDVTLKPNTVTYNIVLKSLALQGLTDEALTLSEEMESLGKFDHVSVNTLVKAMITAREFNRAEEILKNAWLSPSLYTAGIDNSIQTSRVRQHYSSAHPHVEAYTELLDGYAKADMLDKAFETLENMKERNVTPNEVTHTCVAQAMGMDYQFKSAREMLAREQEKVRGKSGDMTVMFNAYITGLLSVDSNYDERVEEALSVFNLMVSTDERGETYCKPNAITVAKILDGLSKCTVQKMKEAQRIVLTVLPLFTEKSEIVKVKTALLSFYANILVNETCTVLVDYTEDQVFDFVTKVYNSIGSDADIIAVNAYLNACCRLRRNREAFQEFDKKCIRGKKNNGYLLPDIATYTILISTLLNNYRDSQVASSRVRDLYKEMFKNGINPDLGLIDVILLAMTDGGTLGLSDDDSKFTLTVLNDCKSICKKDEYMRRKRIVKQVFIGRLSEAWKEIDDDYDDDELFKKKGWNKMESGFQMFGGSMESNSKKKDDFLESKGWNDVDSGFRIL